MAMQISSLKHLALALSVSIIAGCQSMPELTSGKAAKHFAQYEGEPHFKAFAISSPHTNGASSWGWATERTSAQDAMELALAGCKKAKAEIGALDKCRIYALGDKKVFNFPEAELNKIAEEYNNNSGPAVAKTSIGNVRCYFKETKEVKEISRHACQLPNLVVH